MYWFQELVALGEVVGTESRGLSADTLASLPSVKYKTKNVQDGNTEQYVQIIEFYSFVIIFLLYTKFWCIVIVGRCVICRVEFEDGESLIALPCKHSYHPECINQWLQINKVWWTFLNLHIIEWLESFTHNLKCHQHAPGGSFASQLSCAELFCFLVILYFSSKSSRWFCCAAVFSCTLAAFAPLFAIGKKWLQIKYNFNGIEESSNRAAVYTFERTIFSYLLHITQ